MPAGVRKSKVVSFVSSITQSIQARGRALSILSRLASHCQCGFGKRRRWIAKTHLLYKPRVSGSRRKVSPDGKAGVCIGDRGAKIKLYFQAHTIVVLTDKPLRRAISSPETVGWMALWVVKLSEFDIRYCPRTAIKGEMVVDFIAEFTLMEGQGAEVVLQLRVHTDRSSNKQAGRAGVVLHTPKGDNIECIIRLDFPTTNNEVEYTKL